MSFMNLECSPVNIPVLDPGFIPLKKFNDAFLLKAEKPISVVIESGPDSIAVFDTKIHTSSDMTKANAYYVDRLVKMLLWQKGGFRITICGDRAVYESVKRAYAKDGTRSFDAAFMAKVFEHPFEVRYRELSDKPKPVSKARKVGRHLDGCRIGFDAGGSDRKVSAVVNGESVFSEEIVWLPKEQTDPDYHYEGILEALKTAAGHMPRVDAIGVSSAGIYINNRTMVASLFIKVPEDLFEDKVKDIYIRAAREINPDARIEVCNDGDVTALAGAMSLNANSILGIAMGTSEAGGYVDQDGNITGWLNELAFAPVDANPAAMADEWSGDIGCGVKYFSQDAVIKLAPEAGIDLSGASTPAEKLKIVQKLMESDDSRAVDVYNSLGCYLGHTLAYYADFYDIRHVLLLGRVMSGKGGDIILSEARRILGEEYPGVSLDPSLPDEKFRRVGQSVAAASLPEIG